VANDLNVIVFVERAKLLMVVNEQEKLYNRELLSTPALAGCEGKERWLLQGKAFENKIPLTRCPLLPNYNLRLVILLGRKPQAS